MNAIQPHQPATQFAQRNPWFPVPKETRGRRERAELKALALTSPTYCDLMGDERAATSGEKA